MTLAVHPGEAIGLMGRNGMGKTTLIRTLIGLLPAREGTVLLDGNDAAALPVFERARRGIAVVPENRGIFASLSVRENLRLAACPGIWTEAAGAGAVSAPGGSGSATAAINFPVASSRCWRSAAR